MEKSSPIKPIKPVVIIGCPRSGTRYIARVMQRMGLQFGHEKHMPDGEANWKLTPNPNVSFDTLPRSTYTSPVLLHQVRYPLGVIGSGQKIGTPEWRYICRFLPVDMDDNVILRGMYLYHSWNKKAERQVSWRYRIENLPEIWPRFCRMIGHPECIDQRGEIQDLSTDIGSNKPYPSVTWSDLREIDSDLAMSVQQMAERYGYQPPEVVVK